MMNGVEKRDNVEYIKSLEADKAALEARIRRIKCGVECVREEVERAVRMWIVDDELCEAVEAAWREIEKIEK